MLKNINTIEKIKTVTAPKRIINNVELDDVTFKKNAQIDVSESQQDVPLVAQSSSKNEEIPGIKPTLKECKVNKENQLQIKIAKNMLKTLKKQEKVKNIRKKLKKVDMQVNYYKQDFDNISSSATLGMNIVTNEEKMKRFPKSNKLTPKFSSPK